MEARPAGKRFSKNGMAATLAGRLLLPRFSSVVPGCVPIHAAPGSTDVVERGHIAASEQIMRHPPDIGDQSVWCSEPTCRSKVMFQVYSVGATRFESTLVSMRSRSREAAIAGIEVTRE